MRKSRVGSWVAGGASVVTLLACHHAQTQSVAEHDRIAVGDDARAAQEQAEYDPHAAEAVERCSGAIAHADYTDACWTSLVNPTDDRLREARHFRRLAAQQRAQSQRLRDAEARACAGVTPTNRDESPFAHSEDIVGVVPALDHGPLAPAKAGGIAVTFRSVPGLTAIWLQHVIECHIARNEAMGHEGDEMTFCPLVPMGVRTAVTATAVGIVVEIRSNDQTVVADLLHRGDIMARRSSCPLPSTVPMI